MRRLLKTSHSSVEVELSSSVPTGSYVVTVTCADAVVATAALQVTPLLPLSDSTYPGQQLLAAGLLTVAVIVVTSARVWISRRTPKYERLLEEAFGKPRSQVTRADIDGVKKKASRTAAEEAFLSYERSHGRNIFIGKDLRASTSKTIAILWTLILAYILLVLVFVAISDGQFGPAFDLISPTPYLYLVLIGGPFAAAVGAKIVVTSKIADNTLQKSQAENTGVGDLFTDDDANTDLVDTQYTLFNLVAVIIVLGQFVYRPGFGAPEIPGFLAALTGASAAAYLGSKATVSNKPSIERVLPGRGAGSVSS